MKSKHKDLHRRGGAFLCYCSSARLAESLAAFLRAKGFKVRTNQQPPGNLEMLLFGEKPIAKCLTILRTYEPEVLSCLIRPVLELRTELSVSCRLRNRSRVVLGAVIFAFPTLMAVAWTTAFQRILAHDSTGLSLGAVGAILLGVWAWLWNSFLGRLSHSKFRESLHRHLREECAIGGHQEYAPPRSTESLIVLLAGLAGCCSLFFLSPPNGAVSYALAAIVFIFGILGVCLFCFASEARTVQLSSIVFMPAVVASVYSISPLALFAIAEMSQPYLVEMYLQSATLFGQSPVALDICFVGFFLGGAAILVNICFVRHGERCKAFVEKVDMQRMNAQSGNANGLLAWLNTAFWLVFAVALWVGLLQALSFFEFAVIGRNMLLNASWLTWGRSGIEAASAYWLDYKPASSMHGMVLKFLLVCYSLPLLVVFGMLVSRNGGRIAHYVRQSCCIGANSRLLETTLIQKIRNIAEFGGVRAPHLRVSESAKFEAHMEIPPVPGMRPILVISQCLLDSFSAEEVEAILAHEIGHQKERHTVLFALLFFLSRWTLLGTGYLSGLAQALWKLELRADEFAIAWLERPGQDRTSRRDLIRALYRLEQQRTSRAIAASTNMELPFGTTETTDWLPSGLRKALNQYYRLPPIDQMKVLVDFYVFVSDLGITPADTHLPYDLRVSRIQSAPMP